MTAKEMFENIDWNQLKEPNYTDTGYITYYYKQPLVKTDMTFYITFNKERKTFHTYILHWNDKGVLVTNENMFIDMKMLNAINKQVEELGWLDVKN